MAASRVRALIDAAVKAAPSDALVLSGAYHAATSAGIEERNPGALNWMVRAAELSEPGGPVQQVSLESLIERQPEWERRVAQAEQALVSAAAALDVVADALRRSWLDLHLTPLLTNQAEADTRNRQLVAPYSGLRRATDPLLMFPQKPSFDRTALITLAALDLFDLLQPLDQILVSHDVLADLFEQRNKMTFHQPSRTEFAQRLLDLVSRHKVVRFAPTTIPKLDLTADIGRELAALLTEAAARKDGQHMLIHPFPITRVGSLLKDSVSLEHHRSCLGSCSAVLDALQRAGRLSSSDDKAARTYFAHVDQRWPDEPQISPKATLYLSHLSVSYFRHVGLLDRIADAGFTAVVDDHVLEEADALRANARHTEQVGIVIDRLRAFLRDGIGSGKVVLDAAPADDDEPEAALQGIVSLIRRGDVHFSDDRFLNRHPNFELDGTTRPILATLDLVELLDKRCDLAPHRLAEIRAKLWQVGMAFLPLVEDELVAHLDACRVLTEDPPRLEEIAELRSIRETLRLVQLRGWFDPASQFPWLFDQLHVLTAVIARQWTASIPDLVARARCNWVWGLLDLRDWAESAPYLSSSIVADHGLVRTLVGLVTAARDIEDVSRYSAWLEEELFKPLWNREPRSEAPLIDELRTLIRTIANDLHLQENVDRRSAARLTFDGLPNFVQLRLLDDEKFQEDVGYRVDGHAHIGAVSFVRSTLMAKTRSLYAGPAEAVELTDGHGTSWTMSTDRADSACPLLLTDGTRHLRIHGLVGLHPTASERVAMFDALLAERKIAPGALPLAAWRTTLNERVLTTDDIDAFEGALRDIPATALEAILRALDADEATIGLLVPDRETYWMYLAGGTETDSLSEFLASPTRALMAWLEADAQERARWALLLAAHPGVVEGRLNLTTAKEWMDLGRWVRAEGDILAKVGFLEQVFDHTGEDPALEDMVIELLAEVEALDPTENGGPWTCCRRWPSQSMES